MSASPPPGRVGISARTRGADAPAATVGGSAPCTLWPCPRAHTSGPAGGAAGRTPGREPLPLPDHQHGLLDPRPRPRAARDRRSGQRGDRLPRLLRLLGRARRRLAACCGRCPTPTARWSTGCGSSAARASPAGWPSTTSRCSSPRTRSPTPASRSCPRPRRRSTSRSAPRPCAARTGSVVGVIALHAEAPARVHRAPTPTSCPRRQPGGRRDRERPPLRGHPPPPDAGRGPVRPGPGRLRRSAPSRCCCPPSPAAPSGCWRAEQCQVLVLEGRRRAPAGGRRLARTSAARRTLKRRRARHRAGAAPRRRRRRRRLRWPLRCGATTRRARRWSCRWWPPTSWSGSSPCGCPGDAAADAEELEIATSIAGQTAVAIRKVQLIDRLTERNAIKDLLEDLSHGGASPAEPRSAPAPRLRPVRAPPGAAGGAPRRAADEPWERVAEALEAAVGRAFPGSLFDHRDDALRGLVRLDGGGERRRSSGCARSTPR